MRRNKMLLGTASLYAASLLWGTSFIPQKILVNMHMPPFYTVGLRFAMISVLFIFIRRIRLPKRTLIHGAILGLFLYLALAFQTVGLAGLDAGVSAFLTSTSIIFIPIISYIAFKTPISRYNFIAVFLVFIGIFFFNYQSGMHFTWSTSIILTLICSLFFTIHIILSNYFLSKDTGSSAIHMHIVQCLFTAVFSLITAVFLEDFPTTQWSLSGVVALVYLGLVASILCFGLLMFGQKNTDDPLKAGLIISLEPVWAFVFSIMWLNESISPAKLWGIFFIAFAIGLCEWQSVQFIKQQKKSNKQEA